MTVKLYRSNEVGAPAMGTSAAGDLLNIMRACLVEGFGSRTGAGWTMPFSDLPNKLACFKSVTGDTIRLDDSIDYRFASVLGFKTMSDLNTGIEQYPSNDQIPENQELRVQKRESTSSIYDGWMMIVSDNWFYFVGLHNAPNPTNACGFFFGEYESLNPSFTSNFMITGHMEAITSTSVSYSDDALYQVNQPWFARRNYQESVNPINIYNRWISQAYQQPNPFTGSLEFERVWLTDEAPLRIRYGYMSNMHRLLGNTNNGYIGGEMFTVDGKKYVMIATSTVAYAIEYDQYDS